MPVRLAGFARQIAGRISEPRRARRAGDQSTAGHSGAAICLPAALASLLLGVLPTPAPAAARMDVHDQIERAARASAVSLTLMNGLELSGAFHGFVGDWSDTASADARYRAWRESQPEGVPRPGAPIVVVVASGDTLRGSFRGVGDTFLALDNGNAAFILPVSYSSIRSTASGADGPLAEWPQLKAALRDAPQLVGVLLQRDSRNMLVQREAISSVRTESVAPRSDDAGRLALVLVVAVIVVGVICAVELNQASKDAENSFSTCNLGNSSVRGLDARFASSSVSGGLAPWKPSETRRP